MDHRVLAGDVADHQRTLEGRNDRRTERIGIDVAEFTFVDRFANAAAKTGTPARKNLADTLAHRRIRIIEFNRAVDERASALDRPLASALLERANRRNQIVIARIGVNVQRCMPRFHLRYRVLEGCRRELFLTLEMVVDATFFDADSGDDIGHRRAGKAARVKHGCRATNNLFARALALGKRLWSNLHSA